MTKSNYKKSAMASFQWRRRYYVTEKRHQTNLTKVFKFWTPPNQNVWLRQCHRQMTLWT